MIDKRKLLIGYGDLKEQRIKALESKVADLEATVEKLKGELAAAARDAGRLDWLMQDLRFIDTHVVTGRFCVSHAIAGVNTQRFFDDPRAAIDAAINHPGSGDSTEGDG